MNTKPIYLLSLSIALIGNLQAAVTFSVTDAAPGTSGATSTLGSAAVSVGTLPAPITYTITGLDLTSIGGTSSEQIVFTVGFTPSAGSVVYNASNGNVFVNNGTGGQLNNQIDSDETLQTSVALSSTTFAGGLGNLSIGFTAVLIGGYGSGDVVDITYGATTTSKNYTTDTVSTVSFSGTYASFLMDTQGTKGISGVNLQQYTVEITAVPEPSAAMLSCLGLLALLRRRR